MRIARIAAAGLALAAFTSGCSGNQFPTAVVRGTVSIAGKPLRTGTVMFVPNGNVPSASGEIDSAGRYTLTTYSPGDGAVIGPHRVMIVAVEPVGRGLPEDPYNGLKQLTPPKYGNEKTSGLTAEVKAGTNEINFDLDAK
jgi:hypothetical protein